jgi:hypothetical protein
MTEGPPHDETPATPDEVALQARYAQLQADIEAWQADRQARGLSLQRNSRRIWAAMEGWGAVKTQEDWERLQLEAAEDWASGRTLIEMLGGERYVDPPRVALLLQLWRDFVVTYRPEGPAEYMCIAMALLSFDHLLRLNRFVGNLEMRLEDEFFATQGLQAQFEERYGRGARAGGLRVEEIASQLGREALPLLDRLNRMVIRNLKALRDLKTAPLALTVQNYGQLNVAQQQANLMQRPSEATVDLAIGQENDG